MVACKRKSKISIYLLLLYTVQRNLEALGPGSMVLNLPLQSVNVMFVILSLSVEPSFQLFSLGLQIIDITLGLDSGIS